MDYLALRRREFTTTQRVLEAYPEEKADLRPADKSRTAAQLAMTLAIEERVVGSVLAQGIASRAAWNLEYPGSLAGVITLWRKAADANTAAIAALSADALHDTIDFYGRTMSVGDALWIELLDHIHHRGQFSVYLRLAGAKVPSIYGPTADTEP